MYTSLIQIIKGVINILLATSKIMESTESSEALPNIVMILELRLSEIGRRSLRPEEETVDETLGKVKRFGERQSQSRQLFIRCENANFRRNSGTVRSLPCK